MYGAKTVYYAGEMGKGKGTGGKWDTLKQEWCSWALVMPRRRLQRIFVGDSTVHRDRQANASALGPSRAAASTSGGKLNEAGTRVLVVHRKDATG